MHGNLDEHEFPTRNPSADACQTSGSILPNRDFFMLAVRCKWKSNAPKELQFRLGNSDRTCRAWSSGEYEPPLHILVQLLRTEDGDHFLNLAMEGASPAWFCKLQRALKLMEAIDSVK
jgi:hypothetical protein